MAQRPSRPLAWAFGAASGDVVEPPSGLAEAGWQPDQTVPAPYLNFLLSLTGQWVEFLRGPNLGTWVRNAWATSHTYDSPTRLVFAVDTTTPDGAAACYRFAVVGTETGPATTLTVSQTGETWARRTNIPTGLEGPFTLHTDGTRWMLAGTSGGGGYELSTTVVDDGTGTGAIGSGAGSWALAAFDATVSEPKALASSGGRSVLWTASEGFYSDDHGQNWLSYVLSGTARSGDGRDVVFDGVKWVACTQSGQIYASTDGVTFTYKSTLGASAAWQLAAGEAGEVVAYRLGSSSTLDFYRSTNSGSSWSAVTPSGTSLPKYLTSLRYQSGAWLATSSAAPWLWTSTDLVAWLGLRTPAVPSSSSTLFALVFEGGRWTALGNGYSLTSGRAADPMPGAYVPGSLPAELADAGYLRGLEVSDATPADGEVLTWSDSLQQWIPAAGGGSSSPTTTRGDLIRRGASADQRLALGTSGYVLTSDGTDPVWAAPSSVSLSAANTWTAVQTFSVVDSGNTVLDVGRFRHGNNSIGSFVGVAVVLDVQQNSEAPIELGRLRARYLGGDSAIELVPYRGGGTAPTVGVRARATVDAATNGVEVLVAAGSDAPTVRPYIAVGTADLDLIVSGQGTGVLRLARPVVPSGAVSAINGGSGVFASPVAGQMAFATDASGGAKPCWYTGSSWILADGTTLS